MKKFDDLMSVSNEIENITANDAKEKLNDPNVQFIDVRDKESFSKGTIGNAIHLDRGLLEFYLAEGSPPTPQKTTYSLSGLFLNISFSRGLPSAK